MRFPLANEPREFLPNSGAKGTARREFEGACTTTSVARTRTSSRHEPRRQA
jgi:hypothetical protein